MIKQRVTAQKRNKNDLTATQAADICGVNRNITNRYHNLLRRAILSESIREVSNRRLRRKSHVNGMRTRKSASFENQNSVSNRRLRREHHVNGIENFWSFAKGRLAKFNGCASDKFVLHLKECALATKFQAVAVQSQARGLVAFD